MKTPQAKSRFVGRASNQGRSARLLPWAKEDEALLGTMLDINGHAAVGEFHFFLSSVGGGGRIGSCLWNRWIKFFRGLARGSAGCARCPQTIRITWLWRRFADITRR